MPHIISIGSGKGGVGKSLVTSNIGVLLARKGKRVLLIDLDLGAANLHTYIGQKQLDQGIDTFLENRNVPLASTAMPTRVPNLFFINSTNCSIEIANLFATQKYKILRGLARLPYDYVLLDLGAGTHYNILDFFLGADEGILVCTSEPTSIENAFKFLKSVYFRVIKKTLEHHVFKAVTSRLDLSGASVNHSFKLIKQVRQMDAQKGALLQKRLSSLGFKIIMNQVRKSDDPTLGQVIEKVCQRHFLSQFRFIGNVRYDEKVYDAAVSKSIFIEKYSYTSSATDLTVIANQILEEDDARQHLIG
ncbi:MAG: MinD/ParA family protein [Desulfobacteraceae bacterium]|mgnify:CR=1 FL=1|nr:MAG: MinD/ParA family protein [Desulfobacteraceae bacterium]